MYPANPKTMSKRLEILRASLAKKEAHFSERLDQHIATVKQANGQPLNDKRNGHATLRKWDRQNEALRAVKTSIAKTERAIEHEEGLLHQVEASRALLPTAILRMLDAKELTQWRKYPNRFFVPGVDKARIIWDGKELAYKFYSAVTDPATTYQLGQNFPDS